MNDVDDVFAYCDRARRRRADSRSANRRMGQQCAVARRGARARERLARSHRPRANVLRTRSAVAADGSDEDQSRSAAIPCVHQSADQRTAARRLCIHDGAPVPDRCVQRPVPHRTGGVERTRHSPPSARRRQGIALTICAAAATGCCGWGMARRRATTRTQRALDAVVGLHARVVRASGGERPRLAAACGAGSRRSESTVWREEVVATLRKRRSRVPDDTWSIRGGRDGVHTEHLGICSPKCSSCNARIRDSGGERRAHRHRGRCACAPARGAPRIV